MHENIIIKTGKQCNQIQKSLHFHHKIQDGTGENPPFPDSLKKIDLMGNGGYIGIIHT